MLAITGTDFSSSPSRRKPIITATAQLKTDTLSLQLLERFESLDAWQTSLMRPGPWVGGFDLPFGLPRELVQSLGWPTEWLACIRHYKSLSREQIRQHFKAFCDARPVGGKFAHRACDGPAGSSPSMKWVNPPVAYMLHAGVPRLLDAGLHLPGLHSGDAGRVALEAYPGFFARKLIGNRSYKSDNPAQQTPERLIARKDIIHALEMTVPGYPRLRITHAQRDNLAADASGDSVDAVMCAVQAAWGTLQPKHYGLPEFDPLEGWIVSVLQPTQRPHR